MSIASFGYGIWIIGETVLWHSSVFSHRLPSRFEGTIQDGINALMYARLSEDMRGPLAT